MTKTNGVLGRPAAHGHCMGAAAATWRARHYFEKLVLLWILLDLVHVVRGQSIEFTVKPPGYSNVASPTFQFTVVAGANGVNPCATQQCSFQCQVNYHHSVPLLNSKGFFFTSATIRLLRNTCFWLKIH